jgi:hypothetical protein
VDWAHSLRQQKPANVSFGVNSDTVSRLKLVETGRSEVNQRHACGLGLCQQGRQVTNAGHLYRSWFGGLRPSRRPIHALFRCQPPTAYGLSWWMNWDFIPSCRERIALITENLFRAVASKLGLRMMPDAMGMAALARIRRVQQA